MPSLLDEIDLEALPIDPDLAERLLAALEAAASTKGIFIESNTYLRRVLGKYCPQADIEAAVQLSPAQAGIAPEVIDKIALAEIRTEALRSSGLSFLAGMPGGLAMAATIPLDLTQYFVHVLRIEQKLAYLYGWHSFLDDDPDQEDDPQYHLALIIGFASGIGDVGNTVAKVGFNAARTGVAGALSRVMLPRVASKVVPVLGDVGGAHLLDVHLGRRGHAPLLCGPAPGNRRVRGLVRGHRHRTTGHRVGGYRPLPFSRLKHAGLS